MKHATVKAECPTCHKKVHRIVRAYDYDAHRKPQEGDIHFCADCGNASIYDEDLKLSVLTDEKRDKLPMVTQFEICKARTAWELAIRKRN